MRILLVYVGNRVKDQTMSSDKMWFTCFSTSRSSDFIFMSSTVEVIQELRVEDDLIWKHGKRRR